jgi:hypothetical protein
MRLVGPPRHSTAGGGETRLATRAWTSLVAAVIWLSLLAIGVTIAVVAWVWVATIIVGVMVLTVIIWVFVSVLSPAIPNRTCPACQRPGLLKIRRGVPGVRCEFCEFRDEEMHVAYLDEW